MSRQPSPPHAHSKAVPLSGVVPAVRAVADYLPIGNVQILEDLYWNQVGCTDYCGGVASGYNRGRQVGFYVRRRRRGLGRRAAWVGMRRWMAIETRRWRGGAGILARTCTLDACTTSRQDSVEPAVAGRAAGRSRWVTAARLALAVMATGLVGCGYSNESLHRDSVRTVYVDMFQSRSFRRGIEFQLTEAIRKEIAQSTPYKNAERGKADTILEGEILDWDEAAIGKSFVTNRAREIAGTLLVRYRWQDLRTGKLLVDRPTAITTVQYVRPLGEQDFDGYQLAVDQMARQIVESMETPW